MSLHRIRQILPAAWLALAAVTSAPALEFRADRFQPADPSRWQKHGEHLVVEPAGPQPAAAIFTVPAGAAGFYALTDSFLRRDAAQPGRVELRVFVRHAGVSEKRQPEPAVLTTLAAGELFDFDAFLGYLDNGDQVHVAIGPDGDPAGDRTEIDFKLVRAPSIPVSDFPADFSNAAALDAPGAWSLANRVAASSPAARRLAWGRDGASAAVSTRATAQVTLESGAGQSIAAFRVPHSGYYAFHDTWLAATGGDVEARIFVGDEATPRRSGAVRASAGRSSLNADVGYVAKGDVISLVFTAGASSGAPVAAEFAGAVVEWAPRRAPLRVRRGGDGYLDVFEPEAPRLAIDIPVARWITVPATDGDATEAIRRAFTAARAQQHGGEYVGVRLDAGKTYTIATDQVGGAVFPLRDTHRIVFDGNGATLRIASTEMVRRGIDLFVLAGSRNIVFADFTVVAAAVPFTTGEILEVSPRGANTQTVTFRVDPGELDPLKDIRRDGRTNAYAYDPHTPGRLALGSWTHYPGNGNPSLRATDQPGIFTQSVTRTNDSIEPGGKWLVKNKEGGLVYLVTRSGTENVTLSGIDGRASGGGTLRFWQTSGVNILNCRFEPDGDKWISSSADGVHGRGREGVWIEDTILRGICEDIMNTYGQNMALAADGDDHDTVVSLRMFERTIESTSGRGLRMPTDENVTVGDQLVFFNPTTGRVLGYAEVRTIKDGRYTLSNPVPGVTPWSETQARATTMIYNTRVAGRFFVRDSRFMDSMRFGIYIKARGGVMFGNLFEGLSGPAILGMNEPEWPEGPPPTHVWVQGCTFSQNNYGYMPRNRDYVVVDPADISVYTRHFRDPALPDDFRAFITRDQYATSHVKLLGNVFHDWRGMGIAVRNSHNVQIEGNVFLPPVNDDVMRKTFADDPALSRNGHGTFAGIFLDSVNGVRVAGNRFHGLSVDDQLLATDQDVSGLVAANNVRTESGGAAAVVALPFGEWFGATSVEPASIGGAADRVDLGGAVHRAGRLGAGLFFAGDAPAVLTPSVDVSGAAHAAFSAALWACPKAPADGEQVVYAQGGADEGAVVAIDRGRWTAGVWHDGHGAWLDLGPAVPGLWQHVALSFDGSAQVLRGYLDGVEVASTAHLLPARTGAPAVGASFGGVAGSTRLGADRVLAAGAAAYRGGIDEFRLYHGIATPADIAALALRGPEDVR